MTLELPETFDPLEMKLAGPAEIAAHARNIVKNVLDSYTGRFDVLVEAVQNSMDALEARWSSGLDAANGRRDGELPSIVVRFDTNKNEISVLDNGTGITGERLQKVFTPHLSPKMLEGSPTRGHKGVGTTFLLYGHPHFSVLAKAEDGAVHGYDLVGGSDWILSNIEASPPRFQRATSLGDELDHYGTGTLVRIKVDEETRFGRLKSAHYNKIETWELVLRTYTAIGVIDVGTPNHRRPEWLRNLSVSIELVGASGTKAKTIQPNFRYPHEDAANAVSLNELWTSSANSSNRYEMLYVALGKDELEKALKLSIDELENSENTEEQEWLQILRDFDTAVYASWGYKNTLYEDLYRNAIAEPQAKRFQYMNVKGGLLVASVGMPIGETTDHPYATMKPEFRRRMFMVVSFNDRYSPDLGRKTIPSRVRALLEWLERQVQNLFLRYVHRLVKSNDEAPHKAGDYAQAKEELADEAERLRKRAITSQLGAELSFMAQPHYEAELVGLFYSLLATARLPGYALVAVPGSRTRLDGMFDFSTETPDSPALGRPVPHGIAESRFKAGSFSRRSKWLEFKVNLLDLVDDLEADDGSSSKKYFDLIDLAVVWEAPDTDTIGDYDLRQIDAGSWNERDFYGVTHLLTRGASNHTVQVLSVQAFLAALGDQEPSAGGV